MKLYVKIWCPWCIEAMDWMRRRGLDFEVADVIANPAEFRHMQEISGQPRTPTIELPNGAVLADFDTDQLERFLTAQGFLRDPNG
jgi:glutaredoxin